MSVALARALMVGCLVTAGVASAATPLPTKQAYPATTLGTATSTTSPTAPCVTEGCSLRPTDVGDIVPPPDWILSSLAFVLPTSSRDDLVGEAVDRAATLSRTDPAAAFLPLSGSPDVAVEAAFTIGGQRFEGELQGVADGRGRLEEGEPLLFVGGTDLDGDGVDEAVAGPVEWSAGSFRAALLVRSSGLGDEAAPLLLLEVGSGQLGSASAPIFVPVLETLSLYDADGAPLLIDTSRPISAAVVLEGWAASTDVYGRGSNLLSSTGLSWRGEDFALAVDVVSAASRGASAVVWASEYADGDGMVTGVASLLGTASAGSLRAAYLIESGGRTVTQDQRGLATSRGATLSTRTVEGRSSWSSSTSWTDVDLSYQAPSVSTDGSIDWAAVGEALGAGVPTGSVDSVDRDPT